MKKLKNKQETTLFFSVVGSRKDGYTASAVGHSIFTQAETLAELKRNVRDAVICHFGETKRTAPIQLIRAQPKRSLGSAKGEFTMPEDFNDPLPKEIEKLFCGE